MLSEIHDIVTHRSISSEPVAAASHDDAQLLGEARRGSSEAFEALVQPHKQKLFKMILRITQHREDAEDALQEALLRAYLKLDQFEGNSRFSTWLLSIGINQALMSLRKKRQKPVISIEDNLQNDSGFFLWDMPDGRATPEEHYQATEIQAKIGEAVQRLPGHLRTAFLMCHIDDLSRTKVASELGISMGALKSRSFRARRQVEYHLTRQRTPIARRA